MLIRIERQRYGGCTLTPVSRAWRNKTRAYLRAAGAEYVGADVYVDNTEALEGLISDRAIRDLSDGWDVTIRMDPWTWGQGFVGYNAGDRDFDPARA
jgi:uncharacterized protein YfiM (DUF2279 family)